jgi:hypothetical protein
MNNNNLTPYKPGQSGNPKGKRKGTKNLSSILKKMRLLYEAYNGNIRAIQEIFNRTEGKVKEVSEFNDADQRQRTKLLPEE